MVDINEEYDELKLNVVHYNLNLRDNYNLYEILLTLKCYDFI